MFAGRHLSPNAVVVVDERVARILHSVIGYKDASFFPPNLLKKHSNAAATKVLLQHCTVL